MGAQVAIMLVEGKYRNVPNELEWNWRSDDRDALLFRIVNCGWVRAGEVGQPTAASIGSMMHGCIQRGSAW
jgi:hypothetical protein